MKMMRFTLLLLFMSVVTQAFAQRRLVVVDVETLIPVVGANVVSKDGNTTTDSLGYFSVSDSCHSLAFSHVNYEPRMINLTEVRDTVYLISKLLNVREVVRSARRKLNWLPLILAVSICSLSWLVSFPRNGARVKRRKG